MNTEGTQLRVSRTLSSIEASIETQAPEGVPMHHFYSSYVSRAADLPSAAEVSRQLDARGKELMQLRTADPMPALFGSHIV